MQTMFAGFERLIVEGGIIIWVLLVIAGAQIGLALTRIIILKFSQFSKLDLSGVANINKLVALRRYEFTQRLEIDVNKGLPTMKALVAICPLLGLMGTVTGMMQIFDLVGSGLGVSPRLLSSGISHATLPTMVGMAITVLGLILLNIWQRSIKTKMQDLTR